MPLGFPTAMRQSVATMSSAVTMIHRGALRDEIPTQCLHIQLRAEEPDEYLAFIKPRRENGNDDNNLRNKLTQQCFHPGTASARGNKNLSG